jgi:uncharacterized protein (DUF697 family)
MPEMYAFLVLITLALGLTLVQQVINELVPLRSSVALTRVVAVAIGAGLAWMLGYSVFTAFGQELRAEWMHPVVTGLVLVAVGESVRTVVNALAQRAGEPAVDTTSAPDSPRTA